MSGFVYPEILNPEMGRKRKHRFSEYESIILVYFVLEYPFFEGFPAGASGKKPACQSWRHEFYPRAGKIPWRRVGNPLKYSCWENSMDRRACPSVTLWALTLRACNPMGHIPQGHRVGHD